MTSTPNRIGRDRASTAERFAAMRGMALDGMSGAEIAKALGYQITESVRLLLANGKILSHGEYIAWRDATGIRARRGGRKMSTSSRNALTGERISYGKAPSIFALADAIALEVSK